MVHCTAKVQCAHDAAGRPDDVGVGIMPVMFACVLTALPPPTSGSLDLLDLRRHPSTFQHSLLRPVAPDV